MPRKRWDRDKGEITEPEPEPAAAEDAKAFAEDVVAAGETSDPEEMRAAAAAFTEAERPAEPEPGPLSKFQTALQELLDYDQITEIRLALYSREAELEKHTKKGSDLGVREEDARRRLRVIRGSDERFGLVMIFAPAEVTEQRDVFFDREKPNGRPDAESTDETITFRTVDGRDLTAHRDHLHEEPVLGELRALHTAGTMTDEVKRAIDDADIADLFGAWEIGGGPDGEEEEGRELAAASEVGA